MTEITRTPSFLVEIHADDKGNFAFVGTGFFISPTIVVTCDHVRRPRKDGSTEIKSTRTLRLRHAVQGDGKEWIEEQGFKVIAELVQDDLTFFRLKKTVETIGCVRLAYGLPEAAKWATEPWRPVASGFVSAGRHALTMPMTIIQGDLVLSGRPPFRVFENVQIEGGIPEGRSGSPVVVQHPGSRQGLVQAETGRGDCGEDGALCIGILPLGGARSATSRIVTSDVILRRLEEAGVGEAELRHPPVPIACDLAAVVLSSSSCDRTDLELLREAHTTRRGLDGAAEHFAGREWLLDPSTGPVARWESGAAPFVVWIHGPSGVGKSAILGECVRRASAGQFVRHGGAGASNDAAIVVVHACGAPRDPIMEGVQFIRGVACQIAAACPAFAHRFFELAKDAQRESWSGFAASLHDDGGDRPASEFADSGRRFGRERESDGSAPTWTLVRQAIDECVDGAVIVVIDNLQRDSRIATWIAQPGAPPSAQARLFLVSSHDDPPEAIRSATSTARRPSGARPALHGVRLSFEDDAQRADVRTYATVRLGPERADQVELLVETVSGSFQFARVLLDAMETDEVATVSEALRAPDGRIVKTLHAFYRSRIDRHFTGDVSELEERVWALLSMLARLDGGMPHALFAKLFEEGRTTEESRASKTIVNTLRDVLRGLVRWETRRSDHGVDGEIRVVHASVLEFVRAVTRAPEDESTGDDEDLRDVAAEAVATLESQLTADATTALDEAIIERDPSLPARFTFAIARAAAQVRRGERLGAALVHSLRAVATRGDWLVRVLDAVGLQRTIDLLRAIRSPERPLIERIADALDAGRHVLRDHPAQLPSQLLMRLPEAGDDRAAADVFELRRSLQNLPATPWFCPLTILDPSGAASRSGSTGMTPPSTDSSMKAPAPVTSAIDSGAIGAHDRAIGAMAVLAGTEGSVRADRWLVTGSIDGTLGVWDLRTRVRVAEECASERAIIGLATAHVLETTCDGYVAAAHADGTVAIWRLRAEEGSDRVSMERIQTYELPAPSTHPDDEEIDGDSEGSEGPWRTRRRARPSAIWMEPNAEAEGFDAKVVVALDDGRVVMFDPREDPSGERPIAIDPGRGRIGAAVSIARPSGETLVIAGLAGAPAVLSMDRFDPARSEPAQSDPAQSVPAHSVPAQSDSARPDADSGAAVVQELESAHVDTERDDGDVGPIRSLAIVRERRGGHVVPVALLAAVAGDRVSGWQLRSEFDAARLEALGQGAMSALAIATLGPRRDGPTTDLCWLDPHGRLQGRRLGADGATHPIIGFAPSVVARSLIVAYPSNNSGNGSGDAGSSGTNTSRTMDNGPVVIVGDEGGSVHFVRIVTPAKVPA